MATNNASDQTFSNNPDGFSLGGGDIERTVSLSGGDIFISATGNTVITFPGYSSTLATLLDIAGRIADTGDTWVNTLQGGNLYATQLSGATIYSGSTELGFVFSNQHLWVQGSGGASSMRQKYGAGINADAVSLWSFSFGKYNSVSADSRYGFIGNGSGNTIATFYDAVYMTNSFARYSTILNGYGNTIQGGYHNAILSGRYNRIENDVTNGGKYDFISSGFNNRTFNQKYSGIIGGKNNTIGVTAGALGAHNAIIGGSGNYIGPAVNNSVIIGGTSVSLLANNTVAIPYLRIGSFAGTLSYSLGVDASGNVNKAPAFYNGTVTSVLGGRNITIGGYASTPVVNLNTNIFVNNFSSSGASSFNFLSANTFSANTLSARTITAVTISAGTYYSGTTPLTTIITNLAGGGSGGGSTTGPGINTTTGGSQTHQYVNVTGGSFNQIIASGQSNFHSLSAQTFSASSITAITISAGTYYSGTTNLYSIFALAGSIGSGSNTTINNGINTFTAGTEFFQSVNITGGSFHSFIVSADSRFNGLSATTFSASSITAITISAGTYYSGTTELSSLFMSINATLTGGTGEVNTASNLGSGSGLFYQKSGVDLQFKSISGGTGINISATTTNVTINLNNDYSNHFLLMGG